MKDFKHLAVLLFICLLSVGCDKYLDITPKGKRLLTTLNDYDQWMNDQSLVLGPGGQQCLINYLGDNTDYVSVTTPPTSSTELLYTWSPQYSFDVNSAPIIWGDHYAKINAFNTVLVGIDKATGGTTGQKNSLKAEAYLGRALEYFYLLNEYAKVYDATTASTDLAVPFVTSNDVSQKTPPRSTVAEVYQHIIDDMAIAIPNLPPDNSANRYRGSVASAYSLLARLYFYSLDYPQAQKYAELALSNSKAVMLDLNGANPASNMLGVQADVIYGRLSLVFSVSATLDYMRTFAANDLRVRKFYTSTDAYRFTTRGGTQYSPPLVSPATNYYYTNTGTSVQEMKLIAAECAVRANNLSDALQYLDEVRKYRFAAASYVKYSSTNQESVLQEIFSERSHELGFAGLRWFDMRRLDKEDRMEPVYRYNAQGGIVATLEPHSNKYTLQIPYQVMSFNPDMIQNPN
jgi:hypothetical protein